MTEVDVTQYAKCGICMGTVVHPMTLLCQHSFCYDCLTSMIKSQSGPLSYKCPTCKDPFIMPKKTKHNVMIEDLISHVLDEPQLHVRKRSLKKRLDEDIIHEEIREEILSVLLANIQQNAPTDLNRLPRTRTPPPSIAHPLGPVGHDIERMVRRMEKPIRSFIYLIGVIVLLILIYKFL